jgi:hypothetical protein
VNRTAARKGNDIDASTLRGRQVQPKSRIFLLIAWVSCVVASVGFWYLYVTLYWVHRGRFNEAGRYVDEATMVVYQEQGSLLFIPAMLLALLAMALAVFWRTRCRMQMSKLRE